jgi:hypothetical protein
MLRDEDARHHGARRIDCRASPPLTQRQLVARFQRLSGQEPRKRSVGAYRWSKINGLPVPHRTFEKPVRPR